MARTPRKRPGTVWMSRWKHGSSNNGRLRELCSSRRLSNEAPSMTRLRGILRIAAISLAGLMLVVLVTAIVVVQTQWFRDQVRVKIVSAVETATGGTAEIGAFDFDWRHL